MTKDLATTFLTYYVQSLRERTRDEKDGTKFGFDWIIYNLALAKGWTPYRLPFVRSGPHETAKSKTEAEFGVDLGFLSEDRQTLRIFVLKDEALTNKNFTAKDFDIDLRNASAPDLSTPELKDVKIVEVILAFNKDEEAAGVELFERRAKAQGTKVGDHATLQFDRWNLTRIVEEVHSCLLTPALLPQKYFSQFSYVCSQFADFPHGSDEWQRQLIPNWRNFLYGLLAENPDERCLRLLPVAVIILREHGRGNPTVETGWIDLVEWGMLAAWNVARVSKKNPMKNAVTQMWTDFYLTELHRFYREHSAKLAIRYSLDRPSAGGFVDAVVAAVIAHWHLGRLGILGIGLTEILPSENIGESDAVFGVLNEIADWLAMFISANPSAMRPLLDIHHIELWLAWNTFARVGRTDDIHRWILMLVNRLTVRRFGDAEIPFIEGHNSLELVFERVATGENLPEFCDSSSLFLTCLLELTCSLPPEKRDPLLEAIVRRLVLGCSDDGVQSQSCTPIDLLLWFPPTDFSERILSKSLADEGECTTVNLERLRESVDAKGAVIYSRIELFVAEGRSKRQFVYPKWLPASVLTLACLKHCSPLPPEVWRGSIFATDDETLTAEGIDTPEHPPS